VKVLDTTVAVDHLRGKAPAVRFVDELLDGDEPVAASELVRYELTAGVRRSEVDLVERFFELLAWVPVDEEISRGAGALFREYSASHPGLGDVDYLIASTVVVLAADLLTTNVRHFPMFDGLAPPY
jgi:predicted nucleic acid-binding protein